MSYSPSRIVPLVGLSIPTKIFRRLLLPAPFGPRSPKTSPEPILERHCPEPRGFHSASLGSRLISRPWRRPSLENRWAKRVAILNDQVESLVMLVRLLQE